MKASLSKIKIKLSLIIFFSVTVNLSSLYAQYKSQDYIKYIEKYNPIAIEHQKKYKIPASITLAQGLLESGAGKGRLAREANNHFGIKCHDWTGKRIFHDDDKKNDCFRRYSDARDSFDDHALFLVGRQRYASLFALSTSDYRGWAKGLQKCGYATDKAYANKLIKIIEDYELYAYDKKSLRDIHLLKHEFPATYKLHTIFKNKNKQLYIVANTNDTYDLIGEELGFSARKLRSYNEVPKNYPLELGDIIYLQKKNKKAPKGTAPHIVEIGESMHSISQLYGIRIKYLYKINNQSKEYVPQEGDLLNLR